MALTSWNGAKQAILTPTEKVARILKERLNHWHPFGHVILRQSAAPSWHRFFTDLGDRGELPKTVVDVGVAEGTPTLYRAVPNAKYFLIDPTSEALPYMNRW